MNSFQFDRVAFRVSQINRRPHACGAITRRHVTVFDAMLFEVPLDRVCVPRLQLKANMIHVRCSMIRLIAALLTQGAAGTRPR